MLESLGLRFGDLLIVASFLFSGGGIVYAMRTKLTDLTKSVETLEAELKKITDILVVQARHEERMTTLDNRILSQGQRLDVVAKTVDHYKTKMHDLEVELAKSGYRN